MADRRECKDVFATFDKERQGRVPVGMLATLLRCVGLNPSNGDAERIAQKHLVGKSHFTVSEFEKCADACSHSYGYSADDIFDACKVFDRDGSGLLNGADLQHILSSLGERLSSQELEDMIRVLDLDEQGNIRYETDLIPRMTPASRR